MLYSSAQKPCIMSEKCNLTPLVNGLIFMLACKFNLDIRFFFEIHGFLAGTQPFNPARIRILLAVLIDIPNPMFSRAYVRTSMAVLKDLL
jgi:hypothetical protein